MVEGLIRVFIALPVPEEIRMALADRLSGVELPGKPVSPGNWHFTLRFLGSIEQVALERAVAALDQSDLGDGFRVELGDLGAFPRASRASVLWVGVTEGESEMLELAVAAEQAAQAAGLPTEERPFRPHLTLSRIRPPVDVSELLEEETVLQLGWRCEEIVVYESHLGGRDPVYKPLETFSLGR